MWITNGTIADIAVVWAKVLGDDAADGSDSIRGFIVPTSTPGFTAREVKHKLSLRASATAELSLGGVRVGPEALLPEARGLKAPLSCLTQARTGILFGALGAARDCLEVTLDYVGTRTVFGSPLAGYQLTQAKLADMATSIEAARLLVFRAAATKDAGRPVTKESSMAKLFASEIAVRVCDEALQIHGGYGFIKDYGVEKFYRDVKLCTIGEGTSEIQRLVIARQLLKE